MENDNISKLLIAYRKNNSLTQKQLGDLIGVSPKAISKWECGKGLPDVMLLEKISKVLDVSIDDLLKGHSKKKHSKYYAYLIVIISFLILMFILLVHKQKKKEYNDKLANNYPCTMIGNYYVSLINNSNDENYKYITISVFQTEGVYTIKIPSSIAKELEVDKRYKMTLKTKENYQDVPLDTLFQNSEIINVVQSKEEEIWTKYYCDK